MEISCSPCQYLAMTEGDMDAVYMLATWYVTMRSFLLCHDRLTSKVWPAIANVWSHICGYSTACITKNWLNVSGIHVDAC